MFKEFFESIPWYLKYPAFFFILFAGSVFWFEDRSDGQIQAAIGKEAKRLDGRIDDQARVHDSDVKGIRDVMNVVIKQNDTIMRQNSEILLRLPRN